MSEAPQTDAASAAVTRRQRCQRVGVIGAGTMGNGIAQVFAQAGFDVLLHDTSAAALDRARSGIEKSLAQVRREGQADRRRSRRRARPPARWRRARRARRRRLRRRGDRRERRRQARRCSRSSTPDAARDVILASNTSSISITVLGAATKRPDSVLGMHFMNPVPLMTLVELDPRPGDVATRSMARRRSALRARSARPAVEAADYPGFIANRILMPMINEAMFAVMEGVGTRRGDRHGDEARHEPPDGPADAGRLHRPRRLPGDPRRAARRARRSEVPPLSAAPADGRRRASRPEVGPRLLHLRLDRRRARSSASSRELQHGESRPAARAPASFRSRSARQVRASRMPRQPVAAVFDRRETSAALDWTSASAERPERHDADRRTLRSLPSQSSRRCDAVRRRGRRSRAPVRAGQPRPAPRRRLTAAEHRDQRPPRRCCACRCGASSTSRSRSGSDAERRRRSHAASERSMEPARPARPATRARTLARACPTGLGIAATPYADRPIASGQCLPGRVILSMDSCCQVLRWRKSPQSVSCSYRSIVAIIRVERFSLDSRRHVPRMLCRDIHGQARRRIRRGVSTRRRACRRRQQGTRARPSSWPSARSRSSSARARSCGSARRTPSRRSRASPPASISIDYALGVGGVPRGRVIEIFGPESSGKTTLALQVIARRRSPAAWRRSSTPSTRSTPAYAAEAGRRPRQPAGLAARQRRAGARDRRGADPLERRRRRRRRLGRRARAARPKSKARWATRRWACRRA